MTTRSRRADAARTWWREAVQRLWLGRVRVLEATVAATAAWFVAAELFGHVQPFFAPAAALITLGVTRGQRVRRAVEVVVAVAVGVLVADVIAQAFGPRTILAIAIITALTTATTLFVGGSPIFMVQAAVSAIFVVVVEPVGSGWVPSRFVDALIGGLVALAVNQLPFARDPLPAVARNARPVFAELAAVLGETARALDAGDRKAAQAALEHARGLDSTVAALRATIDEAQQAAWLDPLRRRRLEAVHTYEDAARELDFAVRNVRVLARAAVVVLRTGAAVSPRLVEAVDRLAEAVLGFGAHVFAAAPSDGRPPDADVRAHTIAAVRLAREALAGPETLPVAMVVGQIRSTAVDLLRGLGLELSETLQLTDQALGLAPPDDP